MLTISVATPGSLRIPAVAATSRIPAPATPVAPLSARRCVRAVGLGRCMNEAQIGAQGLAWYCHEHA